MGDDLPPSATKPGCFSHGLGLRGFGYEASIHGAMDDKVGVPVDVFCWDTGNQVTIALETGDQKLTSQTVLLEVQYGEFG